MKIREKALFCAFMVLIILPSVFSMSRNTSAASPSGVFRGAIHWGVSADYLDPATAGSYMSTFVLYLFHDALLKPMPDGTYSPCLAESWTISPDSKVYEFKLRRGVKFHNGDTMTAEDVVFSFGRYKASQANRIKSKTDKVEAVNPYLVRFRFKEPFPDFLECLLPGVSTIGWVVPKKYVEKVGDLGFKKSPIGAGPYKFVDFVTGVQIVGEAFEGYWRKVPHIKRMEFRIIPETATRLAMLRRGEVDMATGLGDIFYKDAKNDPKLKLYAPLSPSRWLVYMASQWDPKSPWSNPKVRKAASLAIDRQTLADVFNPGCGPVGSIGLAGDSNAIDIPADPYDPQQARKLLAEAGYPKGFHGGKFYPYESRFWPYGEQIANYWKSVGITVDTFLLDRPAWLAARDGGKMKEAIFIDPSVAPTIGGRISYLFGAASYGNYPDIQGIWNQYQKEASPQARKDLIGRIQRLIHQKTMYILLTSTNTPQAYSLRVKGNPAKVAPIMWFTVPFEDIEMEK
jgi:peptide/nickel transport system substrate-binding protein